MDKLKALLEKRAKVIADMRASIDAAEAQDRDFTAEELAAYNALKADKEQLDQRIERLQGQAISEAHLQEVRPAAARGQGVERVQRGAEARREFENIGEFLHAVRFNPNDQRLNFQEGVGAAAVEGENRAELRTDDGPSGGFVLPPQFRSTIMQMQPQNAIVRPRANVIEPGTPPDGPVTIPALDQTGAAPGNWFGGVQVNWIDEGGVKPMTDMKVREITLTPHEVAGVMVATDKLLRNWTAASSMIETQLRGAVTQAEDFAFILGNGVAKPLGVLNSKATYSVPRLLANNIKYADLVNVMARLLGNGTWFYSRSVLPQLMALQDPAGRYIWQPSAVAGQPSTLLGMPAVENNRNPALGSRGDIWCADLSQYLIKDGSGPFVAASEHVLFQQNKTMIKIFWNVDGSPWLTQPVPLENGYLVSPFVALDVPAA